MIYLCEKFASLKQIPKDEFKHIILNNSLKVYNEFIKICEVLEKHYKDMQDMEFTIENGKLFMLQTRNGKRTASAAIKIAVDLVNEGLITEEEALLRVEPKSLDQLLHKGFNTISLKKAEVVATGLAASPGAATGKIFFTAENHLSIACFSAAVLSLSGLLITFVTA